MYDIEIGKACQIQGWMEADELMWLAVQATLHKNICEIGSWVGRSTRALVDNTSGTVLAVDTWMGSPGEVVHSTIDSKTLFSLFTANMEGLPEGRLTTYKGYSLDAAKFYKDSKFDMIFIDASHDYDSVKADIQAWFPLLEAGGLMCGHDYHAAWPGVVEAVNEIFPRHSLCGNSIWAVKNTLEGVNERSS